jgi:hypothetical protein
MVARSWALLLRVVRIGLPARTRGPVRVVLLGGVPELRGVHQGCAIRPHRGCPLRPDEGA